MTMVPIADIDEAYRYVVSEQALAEVIRLLRAVPPSEGSSIAQPTGPGRSILELEGLGKEIWEGIDPLQYVDDLRDEWNNR